MPVFAVTVLGHDRPGIVAEVTEAIAQLGGNLEDSSMTLLRGHFAMTLVAAVDADADAIREQLAPLTASGLVVSVIALPAADIASPGPRYLVSVHGGDRPGIVSALTRVLADHGGNVVDLTTRLSGSLYILLAEATLPVGADPAVVAAALAATAADLGVDVRMRPADEDVM